MVKKNSENNSENSENSGLQFERIHTFAVANKLQRRVKASAQHSRTSLALRSPCTSLAPAIPGTLGTRLQLIFEMLKQ